jgi:capsular polysaccharide biosynthesis protein
VDFWDLATLLFRRWAIAVPMLLLTIGASLLVSTTTKPDYVSTSYISLIPPAATEANHVVRNPWLDGGLTGLGQAAIVTVEDKTVINGLIAGGYSDNFTLTIEPNQSLITMQVVGKSPEQATNTARRLTEVLEASVAQLQTGTGTVQQDLVTTRRLDQGRNVEASSAKTTRTVVAVAVVGLILTAVVTIGVDALARRRRRPGLDRGDPGPPRRPAPRGGPDDQWPGPGRTGSTGLTAEQLRSPLAAGSQGGHGGLDSTGSRPAITSGGPGRSADPSRVSLDYSSAGDDAWGEGLAHTSGAPPIPSDATIVLPLSFVNRDSWGSRGGRGDGAKKNGSKDGSGRD